MKKDKSLWKTAPRYADQFEAEWNERQKKRKPIPKEDAVIKIDKVEKVEEKKQEETEKKKYGRSPEQRKPCIYPECKSKRKVKGLCPWHWKIAKELLEDKKVDLEKMFKHGRAVKYTNNHGARRPEEREEAIKWFLQTNKM